ncbi:MAG: glycosyltransferase [Nitrospinae bacterium]|nr:glycosyltransferase [Nitrospinota bacterium]
MMILQVLFLTIYFIVLVILFIYGMHRYYMVYLFYKYKSHRPTVKGVMDPLPRVTIQIPLYNEMYVVERLINAVCNIDYPEGLIDIQVLDDSTDETIDIAKRCVNNFKEKGWDITHIHRSVRKGYKAGALREGLKTAKGEFLLLFDADFVPKPDMLKKTIHYFSDNEIGMVQMRWGYLNRGYSLLTQIESILLDGHFMIEHTARNRSGRFFNFNGTAGIWRRSCLESAGGWQNDTLTEDLDISYRAQLAGWKFIFLTDEVSPSELPVEMNAFKSQQHRWAKGSIQTAKKLLPAIIKSKLPLKVKIEACFHLTNNISYLLMVILSLLMYPVMVARFNMGWFEMLIADLPFLFVATAAVSLFYVCSQREIYKNWRRRLLYIPLLMSLGIGLSVNNAKAVLEALFDKETPFKRTPKYNIKEGKKGGGWKDKKYRGERNFLPFIELLLGIYFTFNIYFAIVNEIYVSIPFLALFQVGFLYISFLSFFHSIRGNRKGCSSVLH